MSIVDKLRRYFVANRAPILSIRRPLRYGTGFVRCRCGNSDGFYWGRWLITWRKPYADVWGFDGREWVPAYMLRTTPNESAPHHG